MRAATVVAVVLAALASGALAWPAADWRSRAVYQILTDRFSPSVNTTDGCSNLSRYCGGTWSGVRSRLDYVQGMGFNALWISPHVENTANGYHGYWAKDFYKTNPFYGTEEELVALIDECHRRDIWVMLDIVANHVGYPSRSGDYSEFPQFNRPEYYHRQCDIDYGNQDSVENCWIAGLPDLAQENAYVKTELLKWINYTIVQYGFDGIRIDTVKHVPKSFWTEYQEAANAGGATIGQKGTFALGEVFEGGSAYVGDYTHYMDSVLAFPMYYTLSDAFVYKRSLKGIATRVRETSRNFVDPSILGNFLDNHDVSRFRYSQKDEAQLRNAIAWVLTASGIPIMYYGTEQYFAGGPDPQNREIMWNSFDPDSPLYQFIKAVNTVRSELGSRFWEATQQELYAADDVYVFTRTTGVDPSTCTFQESAREDCGFTGVDEALCENRGCCWKPATTGNYPWCFFPDTSSSYDPLVIVALTNVGSGNSVTVDIANGGNQGRVLVNVVNPSERITIGAGTIPITLTNGQPKVFLVE